MKLNALQRAKKIKSSRLQRLYLRRAIFDTLEPRMFLSASSANDKIVTALLGNNGVVTATDHPLFVAFTSSSPSFDVDSTLSSSAYPSSWWHPPSIGVPPIGDPINANDGTTDLNITDLESDAMGTPWGVTRSWSNSSFGFPGLTTVGNGWQVNNLPALVPVSDVDALVVVKSGSESEWFSDNSDGTYSAYFYSLDKIAYNSGDDTYTLTDSAGNETTFYGFSDSLSHQQRGAFKSYQPTSGDELSVQSVNSDGRVTEVSRSEGTGSTTQIESWLYTYTSSGQLSTVTWRRSSNNGGAWTTIREADYTYYSGSDIYGNADDLKTAIVKDGSGTIISTDYYRYYTPSYTTGGYVGGLKYRVEGDDYVRLAASLSSGTTPFTATNSQLAPYAAVYYEYDSSKAVSKEIVNGYGGPSGPASGQGNFTFTYTSSSNSPDVNSWATKTVETLNNGTTETFYCNFIGEEILLDQYDGSLVHELTYTRYDSEGRMIFQALPSAVTSYSDTLPDLVDFSGNVTISGNSGLIYTYDYANSTTATINTGDSLTLSGSGPGDAAGYLQDTKLQHGLTGNSVLQESYSYYGHQSSDNATIFEVATDTVYRNDNGTGGETSSYSYTFDSGTNRLVGYSTSLPVVGSSENGPNSADITEKTYDADGHQIWNKDENGILTYYAYDVATGALTKEIQDVDTTDILKAGSYSDLPSGWATPTGAGLHLVTAYVPDSMGRQIMTTYPNLSVDYTIYDDVNYESRTYTGVYSQMVGSTLRYFTTGPISVYREDQAGGYTESLTFSWSDPNGISVDSNGIPTNGESLSSGYAHIQSLSRSYTNTSGQVIYVDDYYDFSGVTYSTAITIGGEENINFQRTTYAYSASGMCNVATTSNGTITRYVYDAFDRLVSTWVGTDDTSASDGDPTGGIATGNNMVEVSENIYDGGGPGDSNLTQTTYFTGNTSQPDRVAQYLYDWRDRFIASKTGVQTTETGNTSFITAYTLDNLGEVTAQFTFAADGIALSGFAGGVSVSTSGNVTTASIDASDLRAYSTTNYDEQGRVYRSNVFSVDPSNGHISGNSVQSDYWFDHRGYLIESHTTASPTIKRNYDGVGRETAVYVTDGGAVNNSGLTLTSWSDASTVTNDIVLQQTQYTYDANSNLVLTAVKQRFDNDADTSTGALGTPASGIYARVTYSLDYYDLIDRLIADVEVGTNGGVTSSANGGLDLATDTSPADGIPDVLESGIPSVSGNLTGNVLVTSYHYNDAGDVDLVTDPRGIESKTIYDSLGRVTFSISDWDGIYDPTTGNKSHVVDGNHPHTNQTTKYVYDGDNHVILLTSVLPTGQDNQTTQYVYGVSGNSSINSNDLLAKVEYPDLTTGNASGNVAGWVQYSYDYLGDVLSIQDRNGTTHEYTYDALGRITSDAATLASGNPENLDGSVLRIETAYNSQGLIDTVTSFDATTGGSVTNQIQRAYNGYGQLTAESQEHSGNVTTSTLKTQYAYSDPATGSRLVSMTYPSGKELDYNYGSSNGLNDVISRLDSMSEGSGNSTIIDESYKYLGVGTVVVRSHSQDGIDLTYVEQSGDTLANTDGGDRYTGFDRFGRIIDQQWIDTNNGNVAVDRFQYSYDEDSNRTAMNNIVAESTTGVGTAYDETYTYDDLNQLSATTRNGSSYQAWQLDPLGNIGSVTTGNTTITNTLNSQNELTAMGSTALTYDDNGNTITDDLGHTLVYDAWNRLVKVKDSGGTPLTQYSYDGFGRRITEAPSSATNPTQLYYSAQWQVIEEDVSASSLTLHAQEVWSPVYVDALVYRDFSFNGNSTFLLNERTYALQDANYNVTTLVSEHTLAGDADGNGVVQLPDLQAVTNHWQQYVTGGDVNGDLNHDGHVDLFDLQIISNNWTQTSSSVTWQVAERFVYDAYGQFQVKTPTWGTPTNGDYLAWNYLHQGGRYDAVSNLYDFRERLYSPTMMRWIQEEPFGAGYIDGENLYQALQSNPLNRTDPFGLMAPIPVVEVPPVEAPSGTPGSTGSMGMPGWPPIPPIPYVNFDPHRQPVGLWPYLIPYDNPPRRFPDDPQTPAPTPPVRKPANPTTQPSNPTTQPTSVPNQPLPAKPKCPPKWWPWEKQPQPGWWPWDSPSNGPAASQPAPTPAPTPATPGTNPPTTTGPAPKKPTSPNQMNKNKPRGVDRVDNPHVPGQKPHVHYDDGTSSNNDGTTHDKMNGQPNPSNPIRDWLKNNGWTPPP